MVHPNRRARRAPRFHERSRRVDRSADRAGLGRRVTLRGARGRDPRRRGAHRGRVALRPTGDSPGRRGAPARYEHVPRAAGHAHASEASVRGSVFAQPGDGEADVQRRVDHDQGRGGARRVVRTGGHPIVRQARLRHRAARHRGARRRANGRGRTRGGGGGPGRTRTRRRRGRARGMGRARGGRRRRAARRRRSRHAPTPIREWRRAPRSGETVVRYG